MSRTVVSLVFGVLVFVAALLSPQVVEANSKKARAHYERGTAFYNVSRYDEALKEFESAYLIKQDPVLLFNMAQCQRSLGNNAEALKLYKRYLKQAENVQNRPEVENRIRELEEAAAMQSKIKAGPPTDVQQPKDDPEPEPAATTRESTPAPATQPSLSYQPSTEPTPEPSASTPIYKKWWFWTALGVVAVGAVGIALIAGGGEDDPACPAGMTCF